MTLWKRVGSGSATSNRPALTIHLIAAQAPPRRRSWRQLARVLPQDASEAELAKAAAAMERAIVEVFGVLSRGLDQA